MVETTREQFTVPADGLELAAERWPGDGPLVVLLHAGVADRRVWYDVAETLPRRFDLVAYDRRGFGETPLSDGEFSDAADLAALLRAINRGPAWLVGNSMGGAVALDTALQHPELVAGLVLVGNAVSGWPEDAEYTMDTATQALEERYMRAAERDDREELQRVAAWLWLDGPNQPEGRVTGPPRELLGSMVAGISRGDEVAGRTADEPGAWANLERIDAPAVIACGEYDSFLIRPLQDVARRMPHAEFHLLSRTAHLPMLDQPDVVAELIAETVANRSR